jgi:thiamine pyrophosphate-dependent acetolactate synthase large subunit-like protein
MVPVHGGYAQGEVEFVLVSNEASAGFMADVCGRITASQGHAMGPPDLGRPT